MAKKILIVDDEPDVVSYLEMILQDNGYETLTAENGNRTAMELPLQHFECILISREIYHYLLQSFRRLHHCARLYILLWSEVQYLFPIRLDFGNRDS